MAAEKKSKLEYTHFIYDAPFNIIALLVRLILFLLFVDLLAFAAISLRVI